jgi:hypothetical protein
VGLGQNVLRRLRLAGTLPRLPQTDIGRSSCPSWPRGPRSSAAQLSGHDVLVVWRAGAGGSHKRGAPEAHSEGGWDTGSGGRIENNRA